MKTKSIFIPLAIAVIAVAGVINAQRSHDAAVSRNLNTFNSMVKELELNYVDSIRTDEAFKAAINGLLSTIDPYTEYYDNEDREALMKMTTGEYGGIGSYIMERDGSSYISGPMEDSPAAKAGLLSGDKILRVDTVDVSKMGSDKVTKLLRGNPSTMVEVTVARPYDPDSIKTFVIERRKLQQPSVPLYTVIGNTGYVKLTSFIDKSPKEIQEALESFKNNPDVKNVVLDLRGNGGGLVESAVDIVGYFVPKGTKVLSTRGRDVRQEKVYKTTHSPILPDMPLAVLIDGGSASASEITAGALQDLDRAVLIGSTSYGKGLVQSSFPLPYDGLIKVTVAKYYLPSGRLIQALDYSRRNPDGSVARTPDSLTNVFKTSHGREVRDGGGLKPDVNIDWGRTSRLVYNIVRDFWAFDFATKFYSENPSIPSPSEFEITDTIYSDFKRSIDPSRFKYDKACEEMMKEMRTVAEVEGYLNDSTRAQFDILEKMMTHDLNRDLDTHRKDITAYLADEIIGRYYYDRGKTEYSLRNDEALQEAIKILNDPEEYKRYLRP